MPNLYIVYIYFPRHLSPVPHFFWYRYWNVPATKKRYRKNNNVIDLFLLQPMVPDVDTSDAKSDVMLAGYQEAATEALQWLLGLGYQPGHPLLRSLAAHLTKKTAYLEKIKLEQFLVEQVLEENIEDAEKSTTQPNNSLHKLQCNEAVQKALVEAAFKGCDLYYCQE